MRTRSPLFVAALGLALVGCGSSKASVAKVTTTVANATAASATTTSIAVTGGSGTTVGTTATPQATTLDEAAALFAADSSLTIDQGKCIVTKAAAALGEKTTLELFNNNGDLSTFPQAQQDAAINSIQACVPQADFAKSIGTGIKAEFASTTDVTITDDQATCVGNTMIDTLGYKAIILGGSGTDGAATAKDQAAILAGITKCLPADIAAKVMGDTTTTTTG
jgi:hypothetical protein